MTLDPALNRNPDRVSHIHLLGICGTGMGALAGMLQSAGYRVTGSDEQVYPPMSDYLAGLGIQVMSGYRPENLAERPDLVVVGNVIRAVNPEAQAVAAAGIPYLSFPQTLSRYFIDTKTSLVVCGTHGKTTTSSLLATLLEHAGQEPSFMIGGIVQAFGRNFNLGRGPYFVAEGDEYDTAFFDKGPKFLHYQPQICILTSVEFDHADIYADFAAVKAAFRKLVRILPPDGCLIACLDDPTVAEIAAEAPCRVIGYGEAMGRDFQVADLCVTPAGTTFTVMKGGAPFGDFASRMPGRHNALNSLAVIAVLDRLGIAAPVIASGLAAFQGVRRRQEVRGVERGVTVIDDFAHHPTAVRETLHALRQAYSGQRLIAVFEPRTNSSRRRVFQDAYVAAFDHADQVVVREPMALTQLAEEERFSSAQLVADLKRQGRDAAYFPSTDAILAHLDRQLRPGDVVAILSNGGFDNIHTRLLDLLRR
ncbi:MAG: UDP-N-acetylmuramate:L-alanyl-gamma-D-glutamyl-meso-diaminopimelate ligase [Thermodesulfobacteriota bacterium]